jgi:amino acid permease
MFNKKNIIILSMFVLIAIFSFCSYKFIEKRNTIKETEEQINIIEKQSEELEILKKERGYTVPSEEEIKKQLLELENLKNNIKK